jgi:hypothetical protein
MDYVARNDAVMVPDRGFTKQLKKLRSTLEVIWDWGSSKWKIWDFPKDGDPYHIMTVETKDKTYRELGADVLLQMQKVAKLDYDDILAYLDEADEQIRRRNAKDFQNKIEAITTETFNYARGVLQVQVPRALKVENVVHA